MICENLQVLHSLILDLYKHKILKDEDVFCLHNCPEHFSEYLNKEYYFEEVDICGVHTWKGVSEKTLDELL